MSSATKTSETLYAQPVAGMAVEFWPPDLRREWDLDPTTTYLGQVLGIVEGWAIIREKKTGMVVAVPPGADLKLLTGPGEDENEAPAAASAKPARPATGHTPAEPETSAGWGNKNRETVWNLTSKVELVASLVRNAVSVINDLKVSHTIPQCDCILTLDLASKTATEIAEALDELRTKV